MSKLHWKPGNMLYPVPVAMVSCAMPGEVPNIITIAWAGSVCTNPAMLSVSVRPERYSYHIIKETGEFVVNLTTEKLLRAADFCGVKSGREINKFATCGLSAVSGEHLKYAPVIAESPVNIECRVRKIEPLGSHDLFLAEVAGVSIDDKYLDTGGRLDLNAAGLVVYSHGEYLATGRKLGTFGFSVRREKEKKRGRSSSRISRQL